MTEVPVAITALFAALHTVLIYLLALQVSRFRMKHKVSLGDGGVRELGKAIRAHGNGIEHVPITLVLMLLFEINGGSATALWVLGGAFFASRLLYSASMLGMLPIIVRQTMAAVTYLVPLIFAVMLILQVI